MCGCSLAVLGGKIYAVGGAAGGNPVECYDPQVGHWTEVSSLPCAIVRASIVSVQEGWKENYIEDVLATSRRG